MKFVKVLAGIGLGLAFVATATVPQAATAPQRPGDAAKGQKIYLDQKCNLCHKVGATGGKLGPDLSAVGAKRDAAWLGRYLVNPKVIDPKNKMPAVKVKGPDLDDLIAYLLSLKPAESH